MMAVRQQVEYYFSDENLNRDVFLRAQLDPEGYIPVEVIASFRRLANMINGFPHPDNLNFVLMSLQDSPVVEIDTSLGYRLRRRVKPAHLSVEAPVFVPMTSTTTEPAPAPATAPATATPAGATEAKADTKATAAEIVAAAAAMSVAPAVSLSAGSPSTLRRSPGTAHRSPATGRSPRSPGIQGGKDVDGDWTAVGKKPKAKSGSKDQRKHVRHFIALSV